MTDAPDALFRAWTEFRTIFLQRGASPALIEMLRHAFYAGSAATLAKVFDSADKPDGPEQIAALFTEVHAFKFDISNGSHTSS